MGGPAKALTLIKGFAELGMEVVIIGTQTGKKEDYEQISYSVRDGTVIVDDANPLELAELLVKQKADLMVAGVKERFIAYKLGIAFCDFNHDRVVEFEGFDGFVNFAREVDASINSPVWKAVRQRTLRPEAVESEKNPERIKKAIVKEKVSEEPYAKEYKDMLLKPDFLHPKSDAQLKARYEEGIEMTKRNYATVNPCVMCQPMGSALAFKGIENTMVLYHGSQGCSTYMRLHLAHHFREPVDIASSSLSEKGAVYGGRENLKKGLRNVINRYNPKVIGVATTCLAETIGDDVPAIIREFKEEEGIGDDPEKDIIIIPVSTPSYGESHVSGYIKALDAVVRKFAEDPRKERDVKTPNGKINVIPVESLSPADVRELKDILEVMAGDYIFLPDISETLRRSTER